MAKQTRSAEDDLVADVLVKSAKKLSRKVGKLDFSGGVPWVYNPLEYAWAAHEQYLRKFAFASCEVFMLGMNPGPWGMAQTGVPFGEIAAVRDWLGIEAKVKKPATEHPKRPIEGFDCSRSEVSGRRLWGLFSELYAAPEGFFAKHFVCNYCPLVFMEESSRNVTPDKLAADYRAELEAACDEHLASVLTTLKPKFLVGVGAWAESCLRRVAADGKTAAKLDDCVIGRILHPSPASPAANRDWSGTATKQLKALGAW